MQRRVARQMRLGGKFPDGTARQVSDYVYKYHRAIYFRRNSNGQTFRSTLDSKRSSIYRTGVVRNLLEPCYWMYDKAISIRRRGRGSTERSLSIAVSPTIQNDVLMDQSGRAWERIRSGLDRSRCGLQRRGREEGTTDCLRHWRGCSVRTALGVGVRASCKRRSRSQSRDREPEIDELDANTQHCA